MLSRTIVNAIIFILLAFQSSSTWGRLYKRNGYHYKLAQQQSHGGLFEPSPPDHELPTVQEHEPNNNGKYNTVFITYKHNESPGPNEHTHTIEDVHGGKSGYSIGSGLRSIAQGSANQAYTAVASQHAAAKQAAYIAKNTLAQAAAQAAATAQAALAGKQVILQELEQQAAEAQRTLSRELEQLKSAKITAKLAQQTAHSAYNHVSVLTAAVNNAKSVADQADQTSNEVANQLASQSDMVGQAKNRLEQVEVQLKQARIDYAATKEAAVKAASSAAEAHVNASKAGAHASIGLHDSANQQHEEDESYDEEHVEPSAVGHEVPVDRHK